MSVGNAPKIAPLPHKQLHKAKTVEALEFSHAEQVLGLSGDEGVVLEVDFEEEDGSLLTGVNVNAQRKLWRFRQSPLFKIGSHKGGSRFVAARCQGDRHLGQQH